MTSPLQPVLTTHVLKEAYEALRRTEIIDDTPLLGFMIVRQKLHAPTALRGISAERQAVWDVLIEVATDCLIRHRALFDYSSPDPDAPLTTIIKDLEQDGLLANGQLIGCSFIYHRYIRADLNLSVKEIYDYLQYDERQGRRRTNEYWELLVGEFIAREKAARHQDRINRCLMAIPRRQYVRLATQQNLIEVLGQKITKDEFRTQTLIYGEAGSGKSTIALRLSEILISEDYVDEVVWIDLHPTFLRLTEPSPERLASLICQQLHLPRHPLMTALQDLQSYLRFLTAQDQQLMIILLHTDEWENVLKEAWLWLSHCIVIATSHSLIESWQGIEVECPLLNEDDSLQLFDSLVRQHPQINHQPPDILYNQLRERSGGNPSLIRQYLRAWINQPFESQLDQLSPTPENIPQIWQQQPTTCQQLWLFIDLITIARNNLSHEQLVSEMAALAPNIHDTLQSDIIRLIQVGLIEQHAIDARRKYYRIPENIREIVFKSALSQSDFSEYHDQLSVGNIGAVLSFSLLQQILILPFSISHLSQWLPAAHEYIRLSSQWENWLFFVEIFQQTHQLSTEDSLWFELESVTTLRWLGRFDEAIRRLETVTEQAIHLHHHLLSSAALIEKSSLLFYKHYLHQSLEAAYDANHFLAQVEDSGSDIPLRSRIAIIRALIESKPDQAQYWLDQITTHNATVFNLIVNLELKQGNVNAALRAAKQAIEQLNEDDPSYPRAHNMLGKVLITASKYKQATNQFALAINLQQTQKDIIALARLYNNRSVALMYEGGLDEAEENLQFSLMLHKDIEDFHGWNIARENLNLINTLRSKGIRSLRDSYFPPYGSNLL